MPAKRLRAGQAQRATTDANGNKVGEQGHYPYGEEWYMTNTTTHYVFTNYHRDDESGNDYALHRFNVNRLGRFSAVDPMPRRGTSPQSLNRYSYSHNDPIGREDPSGMLDNLVCGPPEGRKRQPHRAASHPPLSSPCSLR